MTRTIIRLAIVCALTCTSTACGNESAETSSRAASASTETTAQRAETPTAAAPISLASILARIGGTRLIAGQFGVELLPRASGTVAAVVSKADGSIVQGANVNVSLKGSDGAMHDVALAWDPAASAYVGTMPGGAPAVGPATVTVTADGATGAAEIAAINVAPTPVYGGHVLVLGDIAAEVRTDAAGVVFVTAKGPNGYLDGEAGLDLKASVPDANGQLQEVTLAWDAPSMAFVAVLPEGTTLGAGALSLEATMNGQTKTAGFPTVAVVAPTHGGDIIAAADMNIELVPTSTNMIDVYVTDSTGAAVQGSAEVSLQLPGIDAPKTLIWDATAGKYQGEVPANIDLSVAPIAVNVVHEGRRCRGAMAASAGRTLGVSWRTRLASGTGGAIPPGQPAHLVVDADLRARWGHRSDSNVEAVGVGGRGRGRGAMIEVQAPQVQVQVPQVRMPMANVNIGAQQGAAVRGASVQVRGGAADVRTQPNTVRGGVQVRVQTPTPPPPPSVMVSASAGSSSSASTMSNTGTATSMGGVSVMGGASVMFGL